MIFTSVNRLVVPTVLFIFPVSIEVIHMHMFQNNESFLRRNK